MLGGYKRFAAGLATVALATAAGGCGAKTGVRPASPPPPESNAASTEAGASTRSESVGEGTPTVATSWPLNGEDAVFLWENGHFGSPLIVRDAQGADMVTFDLDSRGRAWLGRHYQMILRDGLFSPLDGSAFAVAQMAAAGAFGVEAWISPASLDAAGPGSIISLNGADGSRKFSLAQKGADLLLGFGGTETHGWLTVCRLESARPFHVAVSYRDGQVRVHRDGTRVASLDVEDDVASWTESVFCFGNDKRRLQPWAGELEGICIYARPLEDDEAAANSAAYARKAADRKPLPRIRVKATLVERSDARPPEEVLPYRSSIAVFVYRIDEVVSGSLDGDVVYVGHWAMLDGKLLPTVGRPVGRQYVLILEDFDGHPQLQSALLEDTIGRDYDASMFFDVSD